ncbi:hypothetical protein N7519_009242 [Penicillium mononematosum]|uniref:uncharacterized protein n=1 Tax=Penicillium mononematosum TaxID=268346 RepID=UPI002547ACC2|nr:uncharacterized protein N7519_009242 [Penicillium mononematosum]KAJ6178781.1 hypothetical protein N7519_009242 [Penicillium mononematosum]
MIASMVVKGVVIRKAVSAAGADGLWYTFGLGTIVMRTVGDNDKINDDDEINEETMIKELKGGDVIVEMGRSMQGAVGDTVDW